MFLVLPEIALNVMGTMWIFCDVIECSVSDKFSSIVIQSKYTSLIAISYSFYFIVLIFYLSANTFG